MRQARPHQPARRLGRLALVAVAAAALAGGAPAEADSGGGSGTSSVPAASSLLGGASPGVVPRGVSRTAPNPWRLGRRVLRAGASGDDVRALQWRLTQLGYRVSITGRFDAATRRAVIAFQRDSGLPANGVVGSLARRALASSAGNPRTLAQRAGWVFPLRPMRWVLPPSTWGPDQGIDIATIGGACGRRVTVVSVASGTVVQIGISGFGRWAPVVRLDSGPFRGRYVYYGHVKPNIVRRGDHVDAGQPIAYVGCGAVGISSAPHLELGMSEPGGPTCCPGWGSTAPVVTGIVRRLWASAHASRHGR